MSIIANVEQYMKRYDHLIEKQTRRHNKGRRLSKEEDDELQKLRPTVLTPLTHGGWAYATKSGYLASAA